MFPKRTMPRAMTAAGVAIFMAALPMNARASEAGAGMSGHMEAESSHMGGEAMHEDDHAGGSKVIGRPGDPSKVDEVIRVDLSSYAFSPDSTKVRPGETIRFVLTNKTDLLHEFNIGTSPMHAEHRKEMLEMMQSGMLTPTGMAPASPGASGAGMMKHDDPNSRLVDPGTTRELVWQFPKKQPENGPLLFSCNIPGHAEAGMTGTFTFTSG